jgi:hypothetical protein
MRVDLNEEILRGAARHVHNALVRLWRVWQETEVCEQFEFLELNFHTDQVLSLVYTGYYQPEECPYRLFSLLRDLYHAWSTECDEMHPDLVVQCEEALAQAMGLPGHPASDLLEVETVHPSLVSVQR